MSRRKSEPNPHPHLCKALAEMALSLTASQLCELLKYAYDLHEADESEEKENAS